MIIRNSASKASMEDFRGHVARGLGPASVVLFNAIDVLAIGPRPTSPFELMLSPLRGYRWSKLYTGIDRASRELAETIADDDWLQELRKQRLAWPASQPMARLQGSLSQSREQLQHLNAANYIRGKSVDEQNNRSTD